MSKERLVDLHVEAVAAWDTYLDMCEEQDVEPEKTFDEFVADYLLANGVIVPPCKVRDEVWFIEKEGYHFPRISHGYVQHFDVREMRGLGLTRNLAIQPIDTLEDRLYFFMFEWVGDSVFLTREEVEAKLKESESK